MKNAKKITMILLVIVTIIGLGNCQLDDSHSAGELKQEVPTPKITAVSPSQVYLDTPTFILKVTGQNFINGTAIIFAGIKMPTNFVNASEVSCQIKEEVIQGLVNFTTGSGIIVTDEEYQVQVKVTNSSQVNGKCSNSLDFLIKKSLTPQPAPLIDSMNPKSVFHHASAFNLQVCGSQFTAHSKIVFFGEEKSTQFISSSELRCKITPEDLRRPATPPPKSKAEKDHIVIKLPVQVYTPPPGGGTSNTLEFKLIRSLNFKEPIEIINDQNYYCQNPSIAIRQKKIYLAFIRTSLQTWEGQIFFTRSMNGGLDWTIPQKISESAADCATPKIDANSQGNVCITWQANNQIQYVYSHDDGNHWESPKIIYNFQFPNSGSKYHDMLIAKRGNLHLVVQGGKSLTYIYVKPHGLIEQNNQITANTKYHYNPTIKSDDKGNLYVICGDLFFLSRNQGENWSQSKELFTKSDHYVSSYYPAIQLDKKGVINVITAVEELYTHDFSSDLYFTQSTDNGATWSTGINIGNNGDIWPFESAIALDNWGNKFVILDDNYKREIFFSSSEGMDWSNIYFPGQTNVKTADIATDQKDVVYIVWNDGSALWFSKSS